MLGLQEVILILAILLILFGPKRLPEMAKELGRAIQEFKKASASIADTASLALKDEEDEGKMIVKIARNLGINTEGQSTKQLMGEIESKIVKSEENSDNANR